MTTFLLLWFGQAISLLGSGLTSFALGVWMFERTGSATYVALIGLCAVLPRVLLSPLVGTFIDRWDRRTVMILSDAGAGCSTLFIASMLATGRIEVWHIYLAVAVSAAFGAVQWPAYTATTTLLVPPEQLGRANGMMQLGQAASDVLAPAMAGVLVQRIALQGVILIDVTTFLFAVFTLLLIRFPRLAISAPAHETEKTDTFWQQLTYGWTYINARPGLRGLLLFSTVVNFLWGMVGALITPLILNFTTSANLGLIISIAGGGMVLGSLAMSAWGGPRRRIHGVLRFEFLSGLCFILIGIRPAFWPIALGVFGAHCTIAVIFGSNQAIWQRKVAPEVQGRVFATQQMVAKAAMPLAYLLAGPLAEWVFEPLLATGGTLAPSVGAIVGTGPGRGIGLLFVVMGVIKMGVALAGGLNPRVRLVEDELPDITLQNLQPVEVLA
ncbi:MAG: MFS transporter [Anaerolineae bacterium]